MEAAGALTKAECSLLHRRDRRDGAHVVMRLTDPAPVGAGGFVDSIKPGDEEIWA
jgi:hypothetical protein